MIYGKPFDYRQISQVYQPIIFVHYFIVCLACHRCDLHQNALIKLFSCHVRLKIIRGTCRPKKKMR